MNRRGPIDRRTFVARAAAFAIAPLSVGGPVLERPRFLNDPFTLGVASGEPLSDGFVIWTRLAPDPFDPEALAPRPIDVEWLVAAEPGFTAPVRSGRALAHPEQAHAVHVELRGLEPGRPYWYRFRSGGAESVVGRARTLPVAGRPLDRLRFAFTSCQHYEHGYFSAYRAMIEDDPDIILHLGDYIYETVAADAVRRHDGPEPMTLADYRNRHALYKLDPDLRAAHAHCPWLLTWDDHEVDNDFAGTIAEDYADPVAFAARRAAAWQADYEHMPLRRTALPQADGSMRIYQRFTIGDLASISMLDGRQYRSDQACDDNGFGGGQLVENCAEIFALDRTMLGEAQERWLLRGLDRAPTRWTVVAQQTLFARLDSKPGEGEAFWSEGWSGYPVSRDRILSAIRDHKTPNPVFIGGDMHCTWVTDLKAGGWTPEAPTVASEFVCTSLSASGPPPDRFLPLLPENPHIRFFEGTKRGYALPTVTPSFWRTDFRAINDVRDPRTESSTLASFVVEAGEAGAKLA